MIRFGALLLGVIWLGVPAAAATSDATLHASLQRDLNQYLHARSKIEHISAISLSISLHGRPRDINVTAGRTQYGAGSPVTPEALWEIGSNTKAFTAATILQLEAEGKLSIDQTIGRWLPQYPAWKRVTIRRLLNMTSGIPGYNRTTAWLRDYPKNSKRNVTIAQLISYVYPKANGSAPPSTPGYDYSNTNYLLAQLIIERASGHSYASELESRFFKPLALRNTYYADTQYPRDVRERMVSGYFFTRAADKFGWGSMVGADVRDDSVSWLRAAGGIVSTPQDLNRWARALYTGPVLAAKQRAELLSIVSDKTGKPIAKTTLGDPNGFGLGVAQITLSQTGTVWWYLGETAGYRMVEIYFPRQDAMIAYGLNSSPDSSEATKLAMTIYKTLHAAGRL